ncbi:nucleotidyltransferase (plasmid) [Chondrocystis sp. NIES-4102]|nr:nucleotidyltransferase [Chondrocystis sp. NIES-4102]
MRKDLERIQDIWEAIAKIEKYTIKGKAEFFKDELISSWILLQLQIIGEAARSMSVETKEKHSQINWQDIIDFRNLLVHEYFRVDLKIVWQIIEQEIPILKNQINSILQI